MTRKAAPSPIDPELSFGKSLADLKREEGEPREAFLGRLGALALSHPNTEVREDDITVLSAVHLPGWLIKETMAGDANTILATRIVNQATGWFPNIKGVRDNRRLVSVKEPTIKFLALSELIGKDVAVITKIERAIEAVKKSPAQDRVIYDWLGHAVLRSESWSGLELTEREQAMFKKSALPRAIIAKQMGLSISSIRQLLKGATTRNNITEEQVFNRLLAEDKIDLSVLPPPKSITLQGTQKQLIKKCAFLTTDESTGLLHVPERVIKTRWANIFGALGVKTRLQAFLMASRDGLLD